MEITGRRLRTLLPPKMLCYIISHPATTKSCDFGYQSLDQEQYKHPCDETHSELGTKTCNTGSHMNTSSTGAADLKIALLNNSTFQLLGMTSIRSNCYLKEEQLYLVHVAKSQLENLQSHLERSL